MRAPARFVGLRGSAWCKKFRGGWLCCKPLDTGKPIRESGTLIFHWSTRHFYYHRAGPIAGAGISRISGLLAWWGRYSMEFSLRDAGVEDFQPATGNRQLHVTEARGIYAADGAGGGCGDLQTSVICRGGVVNIVTGDAAPRSPLVKPPDSTRLRSPARREVWGGWGAYPESNLLATHRTFAGRLGCKSPFIIF